LEFKIVGELAADREFVLVHWQGQGTHRGPAFDDFSIGPWPTASGKVFHLAGHSGIKLFGGKVVEEAIWSAQRLEQTRKSTASLALYVPKSEEALGMSLVYASLGGHAKGIRYLSLLCFALLGKSRP
jgi:hypothetical protein